MKTVLITGGASGIGAATAKWLCKTMRVIVADLDGGKAEDLAAELRTQGRQCHGFAVDVADADSVRSLVRTVEERFGPLDALFTNAGSFFLSEVSDMPLDTWTREIDVHVKGTFLCCQAVLAGMAARREGAIVTMSSDYAVRGMRGGAAYAASKSAIFSLMKSLALEFAPQNIRINAVGPGPIETPLLRRGMTDDAWTRFRHDRAAQVPMGRLGQPEEVASVVDFLLSDRARFITGQIIHPNGGQLSW
ncbi:3-oxoacyl-[acyl-carrier-protein] reductase FabG [Hartmannibacter diazotrophicus]|uniref:3-oxoacyl-[acyl-carrier-protein] reductase FabG n=1 Tax=Hartmannibacter diazotrophicus TaxID=1482074 RepID=A0A2C9D106_9HYPH|nr:SDR family NAD(P)-dependent oxidoreductase [Hartmannibacter diazotrophicus]SON54057.1 3-oxoacyl-[acyl-carrier-protein] reductase FabG [Hartmannibacter diazotrophicus]